MRQSNKRPLRPIIPVIIGEGLTEQRYFKQLADILHFRCSVKPRFFTHVLPDIICLAQQTAAKGIIAICVLDADISETDNTAKLQIDHLRSLESEKIIVCDTLPAIEYWFLLHFENTNRHLSSHDALTALAKHIHYSKTDKFLNSQAWVATLAPLLPTAISRAKALQKHKTGSYSNLYKAFEILTPNT